jgi:hypothetical protein
MCPGIAKIILNGSCAGQQDPAWLGFLETGVELQRLYKNLLGLSAGLLLPKNLSKLFFIFGDFPKHVGGHVANFQG